MTLVEIKPTACPVARHYLNKWLHVVNSTIEQVEMKFESQHNCYKLFENGFLRHQGISNRDIYYVEPG